MPCAKPGEYQPASTAPVEIASHISLPPTMALGSLNSISSSPPVSLETCSVSRTPLSPRSGRVDG